MPIRCADYEMSLAVFMGGFSLFGMLPVIPGPCGVYRISALKKVLSTDCSVCLLLNPHRSTLWRSCGRW